MPRRLISRFALCLGLLGAVMAGTEKASAAPSSTSTAPVKSEASRQNALPDSEVANIVKNAYRFVAMYNVNNKMGMQSGWNRCVADTALKDHTLKLIARPNNDTLYIMCALDLRQDPIVLEIPAFDSKYASLMVTGYDHYVTVPMSVTKGDFKKSEKVLFYSARTEGYRGEPIDGIDRIVLADGDFLSAVFRVMPHAADQQRFARIVGQMQAVKAEPLSVFQGKPAKSPSDPHFPPVSDSDADTFAGNFLAVMQFAVNHTTFDAADAVDSAFLQAMSAVGIQPGSPVTASQATNPDGEQYRRIADEIKTANLKRMMDKDSAKESVLGLFKTKGNIDLDLLVLQSVIGPIGLPASEAVYPPVLTKTGEPLNAMHDYVLHMSQAAMPPARSFWSVTLYDSQNGFFIPNERKKYSVGENAGMRLNADGGIDIYIAAQQPEGIPEENWLPINRQDQVLDVIMRLYDPDLDAFSTYRMPVFEQLPPHQPQ